MRMYKMAMGLLLAALLRGDADAATEGAEITIAIRGEHKGVILALLEAVDQKTTITGITALDSLSSTYGLIGIYRTGRGSGFYGHRFRLTFPPGADVEAIAEAYQNVWEDPPSDIENAGLRLLAKVGAGTASGLFYTAAATAGLKSDSSMGFEILGGAIIGCSVGFPLGVTLVDPYDSGPKTLLAGVVPILTTYFLLKVSQPREGTVVLLAYGVPVISLISSLTVSELSRQPPQDRRVSLGLSPTLNSGLSAVATLRF